MMIYSRPLCPFCETFYVNRAATHYTSTANPTSALQNNATPISPISTKPTRIISTHPFSKIETAPATDFLAPLHGSSAPVNYMNKQFL
jgi:hypothetical protein